MKKILLTLLAVLMFATAGTANVLAEASDYDAYISFGDSITRGLGSEGSTVAHSDAEASDENVRIVTGAYNSLVGAEFVGIDETKQAQKYYSNRYTKTANKLTNYYPVAGYGLTVNDALDLISKEPTGKAPLDGGVDVYEKYGAKGTEGHIRTTISAATNPLITVNLGLMDVMLYSSADGTFQENVKGADEKTLIAEYEKAMFKAYLKWAVNYDKFIGELVKLRKDYVLLTPVIKEATIALVGFFNPLRGVTYDISLGEDKGVVSLPIGTILDPIVGLMNETSRFLAKKYNSEKVNVVYADVSNGEGNAIVEGTAINEIKTSFELNLAVHGTPSTYTYMANQIIKAVNGTTYKEGSTDIVVDLIRFSEPTNANKGYPTSETEAYDIEYTTILDGKKNNHTFGIEDTILTVTPAPTEDAKNHKLLQVIVKTNEIADGEAGNKLHVKVTPETAYTTFDEYSFVEDQKDGKIVKAKVTYDKWGTPTKWEPDVEYYYNTKEVKPKTDYSGIWYEAKKAEAADVTNKLATEVGEVIFKEEITKTTESINLSTKYSVFNSKAFTKAVKDGLVVGIDVLGKVVVDFSDITDTITDATTLETTDDFDKWVKATPKKYTNGDIYGVTPVTAIEQEETGTVTNVAVLTYVLMWRGDHYEAYSIDTTNSVTAKVEKILSPITAPFKAWKAKFEDWKDKFEEWYANTNVGKLNTIIADYKDAKEAVEDAVTGSEATKAAALAALQLAKADYDHCKEAYETALKAKPFSATTVKAKVAYETAEAAYKAAQTAYKDAITADLEAKKEVIEKASSVVEGGIDFAKSSTKWAYDYITHLGN